METKVENGKDYSAETKFIDQFMAEIFFPTSLFDNIPKAANQGSFGEDFTLHGFWLPDCPQRCDAQRIYPENIHDALLRRYYRQKMIILNMRFFLRNGVEV